ncbi:type II toxin-antitoxin system RelE/ParE family toxin [uncultured Amphritea sp.]|jgi:phage-related protein|uniref:type II toxin-antitoxin system RelE/ParE family toxin n=1 Tax=uncultured Amphritea sp. TaxID=981605 RepID=UPI002633E0ED|nr:type II toxin-antitoxin system RelE/ParE family toxin [uncultured Amphritea sp.]
MPKKFQFINAAAKREFLALPKEIQQQFSTDLNAVCQDETPFSDFKELSSSVGKGAIELIENGSPAYRTIYCAKYIDTVFILHAFTKTTNGVDRKAMDTASKRYKDMMEEVRSAERQAKAQARQAPKSGKKTQRKRKRR